MSKHRDYSCPVCKEWIEILPTTPSPFNCPWCDEKLRIDHDLSKLVTAGSHWDDDV